MNWKQLSDGEFVLVFDAGDKVKDQLLSFAVQQAVESCHFVAIGAFRQATIAYFNVETKQYEETEINEQVEVASLIGNVARQDDEWKLHAHVVVGKRDGSAQAGHLVDAEVRPTLELFLTLSQTQLLRSKDDTTGLALIDLANS
jgi:hypothetical protein